jgi:hypothetical protein
MKHLFLSLPFIWTTGCLTIPKIELPKSLDEGLVIHYAFEGNATDSSGNGNHALISDNDKISYTKGVIGKGMKFEKAWLTTPDISGKFQREFSLSVWVYRNNADRNHDILEAKTTNGGELNVETGQDGKDFLSIRSTIQPTLGTIGSFNLAKTALKKWYHVAVVWSMSNQGCYMYVDGKEVDSKGAFVLLRISTPFRIGRDYESDDAHWDGAMDELRIYDRPLSREEILILARAR